MRFLIQRVSEANVTIDGETVGAIGQGFCVLIGVSEEDTKETADLMVRKMLGLRIFQDENEKTNLSLADVGGFPSSPFMQTAGRGTDLRS